MQAFLVFYIHKIRYNKNMNGTKKTVSLKRLSSCTTAEHLYRQASLMFLFMLHFEKPKSDKKL